MIYYLVYWTRKGWANAFEADVYATDAAAARAKFATIFPADVIVGVKMAHGSGRWVA